MVIGTIQVTELRYNTTLAHFNLINLTVTKIIRARQDLYLRDYDGQRIFVFLLKF